MLIKDHVYMSLHKLREREETGKSLMHKPKLQCVKLSVLEEDATYPFTLGTRIREGYVQNVGSVFDQIEKYVPFSDWDTLRFRVATQVDSQARVQSMTANEQKKSVWLLYHAHNQYAVVRDALGNIVTPETERTRVKNLLDEKFSNWAPAFFSDKYSGYEFVLYIRNKHN